MPKAKTKAAKKGKKVTKRIAGRGSIRRVQPDNKLAAIVGSHALPRSEVTRKLWAYIKKHGLQDKKKRTRINIDKTLRHVFRGRRQVSMVEMAKYVDRHIRAGPGPGR